MKLAVHEERFLKAPDGTEIRVQSWLPTRLAHAGLVFVHGWAEYSDRYLFPVEYFSPKGYACYALDCRGHGKSGGRRGFISRFDEYLDDLEALLADIYGQWPEQRLILVGHSQGGLVATRFMEERGEKFPLFALVLSSPWYAIKMKVPLLKEMLGHAVSTILPGFAQEAGVILDDLTHDKEVVKRYAEDPLVLKKATARWFTECLKEQKRAVERAANIKLPTLVMYGTEDRIADAEVTKRVFERLAADDKTLQPFEGFYHEIFNEIEREKVFKYLDDWLTERVHGTA